MDKLGMSLIQDSLYNKGTGWPKEERDRLGVRGLIPPHIADFKVRFHNYSRNFHHEYPYKRGVFHNVLVEMAHFGRGWTKVTVAVPTLAVR